MADLVGALIFSDFLAHQKNIRITLQFFRERFIKGLTIRDFSHRPCSVVAALSAADLSDFVGDLPAATDPLAYV